MSSPEVSGADIAETTFTVFASDKRHAPTGAASSLDVMAHNLGRAVGRLAGPDVERATAVTLQRKLFTMPGRLVHSGRRRHLRLPANWPWADPVRRALTRIHTIPLRC